MKKQSIAWLIGLILTSSCAVQQGISNSDAVSPTELNKLYRQSIIDANYVEASEVYDELWAVSKSNTNLEWKKINGKPHVLVVTWSQAKYFDKSKADSLYNTGNRDTWVTLAPELQLRMQNLSYRDTTLRLKQLLGLPRASNYTHFIELWVEPSQLFRPCFDKEIEDNSCDLCSTSNIDSLHNAWITRQRMVNYNASCDLQEQYPWTMLGYTYDWNPENSNHIGLSEFVIYPNSNVKIHRIASTTEYLETK